MADSTRKKILDAVKTALTALSSVALVTEDQQAYNLEGTKNYPRLYLEDMIKDNERLAYPHATSEDMEAVMELTISGMAFKKYKSSVPTVLDTVEQQIYLALDPLSVTGVCLMEVLRESSEKKYDSVSSYGSLKMVYNIKYYYNHLKP